MSDTVLRSGLIRLAYANPDLRPALLPLIEKHAGEGDMAAVLDAEADPTSHDQNLPEHYYFGKTAEERLENIEKMLSQFAAPASKNQNKPQSYYGLPPKGKQASTSKVAANYDPTDGDLDEQEAVRDEIVAALAKKFKGVKDSASLNAFVVGDKRYSLHGEWVEGRDNDLKARIQVPTRAKYVAAIVKAVVDAEKGGKQASVGRTAIEFPSEEALKQYLRDHPKADKKKHTVRVDPTYEKHHAKVESSMKNQYNDVMKHLADEGVTEDEAFADDYELMGLGRKWWSAQVKLQNAKKSPDYAKLRGVLTDVKDIAGKMKARITELAKAKKGKKASVKAAARPLGPGVHVIEDLSVLGPNFRLVFRELGGDFLGSEQVPGYYLDLGGLLKLVYKTPKMSPAGDAQAKKTIAKLLAMMKAGSTKTAGGSGAANAAYLRQSPLKNKILQAVAKHYGTSVSAIEAELTDPDAEAVFEYIGNDAALQMQVYREFNAKGFGKRAAAGIPVTLKKPVTLKDGTVIEAGTRGTLRFNEQVPRQAIVDFDTRPNTKLGVANLFDYFGRPFMKVPSMSSLSRMADGLSKSVTGKTVEPDGYGPDGSPSWLLILGMV